MAGRVENKFAVGQRKKVGVSPLRQSKPKDYPYRIWYLTLTRPERVVPSLHFFPGLKGREVIALRELVHTRFPHLKPDPWLGKRLGL